jgi:hypothetical protein
VGMALWIDEDHAVLVEQPDVAFDQDPELWAAPGFVDT